MENQCTPIYENIGVQHTRMVNRTVRDYLNSHPVDMIDPISPAEVADCIKGTKNKKAPDHDKIRNRAFKLLDKKGISVLVAIFNAALRIGYFPNEWKKADIIMLPKPGKDPKFLDNYPRSAYYPPWVNYLRN